ncbi:Cyclic nucleotide-gated potassium channel [Planctomycetes bacterium Pan216]|uniref:Cyclic nucleotide-gated potassium channel n=1 Tax=Kolteria novifilia TaxID=2527975 RepID=A0A518BB77_9BACT|nr:Cyclic nucleotide-gated potassium channel [Planctomycetes bacterium Pan216]
MLSIVDKVLLLKRVELFRDLPGEEVARIAEIAEEIRYPPEAVILEQGSTDDCRLDCIIQGEVLVQVDGRRVSRLHRGDCFGELSLIDSEPRSATIIAETEVVILRLSREIFLNLLEDRFEIARGLIVTLVRRLRVTYRQFQTTGEILPGSVVGVTES